MSWQDDVMAEEEIREYWWSMGEAVMREMMEDFEKTKTTCEWETATEMENDE